MSLIKRVGRRNTSVIINNTKQESETNITLPVIVVELTEAGDEALIEEALKRVTDKKIKDLKIKSIIK